MTRLFISIVAVLAVSESIAFNAVDWHGKRELFAREADRLRAAYANCVAQMQSPAENVTVPVETFPDGSVKVMMQAQKAQYFLKDGFILCFYVTVTQFNADGTVSMQILADNCIVDRATKSGWADGMATVKQNANTLKGRGVYFSSSDEYVRVTNDADIKLDNLKFEGGLR